MFAQLFFFVFLLLVLAVLAFKSFVTVKEGEYAAIIRLGKFVQVCRPGWVIVIPFLDRVVRVPVNQILNWHSMSEEELEKKVADLALRM